MEDFFPLECREILANIGARIRLKRLEARVRQADLARSVGVSAPTISRIEAGDHKVETGTVLLVLRQLGLLDEVIGRIPSPPVETTQRRVRLSRPEQDGPHLHPQAAPAPGEVQRAGNGFVLID